MSRNHTNSLPGKLRQAQQAKAPRPYANRVVSRKRADLEARLREMAERAAEGKPLTEEKGESCG